MIYYYDTSFLVSAVLGQHREIDYDAYWMDVTDRVSSHLLCIESYIALQRAGSALAKADTSWITDTMNRISPYLQSITFKYIDDSIEEIIRSNSDLSRCRTLDAIHLGTALYFQSRLSEPLNLCSLDSRMREAASKFGFRLVPEL